MFVFPFFLLSLLISKERKLNNDVKAHGIIYLKKKKRNIRVYRLCGCSCVREENALSNFSTETIALCPECRLSFLFTKGEEEGRKRGQNHALIRKLYTAVIDNRII